MTHTEIFSLVKFENFHDIIFDIFLIFAQNIDFGYTLDLLNEAVLKSTHNLAVVMSTHNLCFGAKIRKIGIPLHTPVSLFKSGV